MDTEEPKSRIQETSVCVRMRVCVHVYVQRVRKRMTVNINISETNYRDGGGPQNSPETPARRCKSYSYMRAWNR